MKTVKGIGSKSLGGFEMSKEADESKQKLSCEVAEDKTWIKCLICNKTSYHTMDITYLYCGHCHKFHK